MLVGTSILVLILTSTELTGTSVMPVLRIAQGARAASLGEAYTALADDAYALFWNPAGLGRLSSHILAFSHHQWFSQTHDELINAALPAHRRGCGLSLLYSAEPGIEGWDEQNFPLDTFSTWNALLSAGWGAELIPGYSVGIGVKGFYQNLRTAWGYGAGTDVGLIACPLPGIRIGLVGRNIGKAWYEDLADLPTEAGLGVAWCGRRLTATLDLVYPLDNDLNLRSGLEFVPANGLALRMGYRTGNPDLSSLGWTAGLTAGVGITMGSFGVDYAVTPYGRLGTAHRLTLRTTIPQRGKGTVRIQALDARTMQPLRADIALTGVVTSSSQLDRTGEMVVTGLRPGQLIIRTELSGYAPRIDTMDIIGDREQTAIIALEPLVYGGLHGGMYDAASRQPLGGTIGYSGRVSGDQTVDARTGTYAIRDLPAGTYVLTATAFGGNYITQTCTVKVEQGALTEYSFYLTRRSHTVMPEGVTFESGRTDILPPCYPILDRVGQTLLENPSIVIEIAGHADAHETVATESISVWELSQARATVVRDYLVNHFGISPSRLVARGYGDTQPVDSGETETGMARNRRAEFRLLEE